MMHFCLYSCFVIAHDVERKETTLQSDTNITLRNNKLQLLIKSSLFYNMCLVDIFSIQSFSIIE